MCTHFFMLGILVYPSTFYRQMGTQHNLTGDGYTRRLTYVIEYTPFFSFIFFQFHILVHSIENIKFSLLLILAILLNREMSERSERIHSYLSVYAQGKRNKNIASSSSSGCTGYYRCSNTARRKR